MHLLSSDKIFFFNCNMVQVFGTLCCFCSKPFLKQLASYFCCYASAEIPKFFLLHPRHWNIFFGRFKSFLHGVNERQVITHKKCVSLICCFGFFRNQLWQHLTSYNSFWNMNMWLLEVAMCEKCRSSHFQSERGLKIWGLGDGGLKNFRTAGKGY